MKKYLEYLKYIIKHKWFVLIECINYGIVWRGVIHDLSKLLPDEFIPYAKHFYGTDDEKKSVEDKFDKAWLLHQKRNKHHRYQKLVPWTLLRFRALPKIKNKI